MNPVEGGYGRDRYAEWDAAYVLGALSPSDRRAYEQHLAGCATCRAAVAELAGLPGLLGTLTPAHAEALVAEAPETEPPGTGAVSPHVGAAGRAGADDLAPVVPLARLARTARRSRLRRRTLSAVAAGALVVAGAVGGAALAGDRPLPGTGLFGTPDGASTTPPSVAVADARTVELRPVGGTDMRAELVVTPTTWGTRLRWSCHYPPEPGQVPSDGSYAPAEPVRYELVLVGRDGARTVAGSWSWSGGTTTGLDASSAVPLTDVDRIEITLDGQEEALAAATL